MEEQPQPRRLRCCIIGAGASGLATAKSILDQVRLTQLDMEVHIFEQSDRVGGNWVYREPDNPYFHTSPCYASLHTNTPRDATAFSDMPMPVSYPHFPRHDQVLAYLEAYAEWFGLVRHTRFHTRVTRLRPLTPVPPVFSSAAPQPLPSSSLSSSSTSASTSPAPSEEPSQVSSLTSILLSSILKPFGLAPASASGQPVDNVQRKSSSGQPPPRLFDHQQHCWSDEPAAFRPGDPRMPQWEVTSERSDGERVTEVFDAVAVCNGHHWSPNPPPFDVSQFQGRVLHSHDYREASFCAQQRVAVVGLGASGTDITEEVLRVCTRLVSCSSRWDEYRQRGCSLDTLKNFFPFLNDPRCSAKGIPVRAVGSELHFADGSSEEVDVVIHCTGYRLEFPFLDEGLIAARQVSPAHPTSQYLPLYKFLFLPHVLSIAFIAVMNVNGSLHPVAEAQGQLFARFITGQCRLPSERAMVAEVERWHEMVHKGRRTYRVMEVDPSAYVLALRRLCQPEERKL